MQKEGPKYNSCEKRGRERDILRELILRQMESLVDVVKCCLNVLLE